MSENQRRLCKHALTPGEAVITTMSAVSPFYCGFCEMDSLRAEVRDLTAALAARDAALNACRIALGTGNALDDFEARAERFYRATGMMAPGKDEARGMGCDNDERRRAYSEFAKREYANAQRLLAAIPAPADEGGGA